MKQKYLKNNKKLQGFTLIELLVVISIISLIASIIAVSVKNSRVLARNSVRNGDIQNLNTAFGEGGGASLPNSGGSWACISLSCYATWNVFSSVPAVDAFLSPYLGKPTDPSDSTRDVGGYLYNNSWSGGTGLDGFFTAGSYLTWVLEGPYTVGMCAPGRTWSNAGYEVQCMLQLN